MKYAVLVLSLFAAQAWCDESAIAKLVAQAKVPPKPHQCITDKDCAPGDHCAAGTCVWGQGCHTDADCGPNSKCLGGICN